MRLPIAIWLLEPGGQNLRVKVATGVTHHYLLEASATLGDGSVISKVVETGKAQIIYRIDQDNSFSYPPYMRQAGWTSVLTYPIRFRGQIHGVIEVLSAHPRKFDQGEIDTLRRLAELGSLTIEYTYQSRKSQKLALVVNTLSATPDFGRAMQVIVDSARELTNADSSTIFLLETRTNSLLWVGARQSRKARPDSCLARQVV
jgi:GAF domain-containing protein